jgi:UDP-galactose transporter B1
MFSNNFVSLVANIALYIVTLMTTGDDTLTRVINDHELLTKVLMIGTSGAIGQIFIFFAISLFNCYVLTIITTTRKLFSVLISNIEFNHHFTMSQWCGAGLVMICTLVELFMGKKGKDEAKAEKKHDKKE